MLCVKSYKYIFSISCVSTCRFYPSCSNYALEAIKEKGTVNGVFMFFKRIIRCHPFARGGYDPVI